MILTLTQLTLRLNIKYMITKQEVYMFLFNRQEVYTGFEIDQLSNIREILATNKIKYKYRVVNLNVNRNTRGLPGFTHNRKYDRQYYIYVQKKDYEQAKYLVNKAIHD